MNFLSVLFMYYNGYGPKYDLDLVFIHRRSVLFEDKVNVFIAEWLRHSDPPTN